MTTAISLPTGQQVTLTVTPNFEIFYNNGYGIYNCLMENQVPIVIKGSFALPLHLHQLYEIEGEVVLRKFDKQINVTTYRAMQPKGKEKIVTYLTQLPGLKKRAEIIYLTFGNQSIDILKKEPEKVAQTIKGISEKKAREWQDILLEKESEEKDILFLLDLGLSSKQAIQLREQYGSRIRKQIRENPYILLSVSGHSGYGFTKCDQLAKKMGFDFGHPVRIREGLIHCLKEAAKLGHAFLPKEELAISMQNTLGVSLTFSQMEKIWKSGGDTIEVYSRIFKINREELHKRLKKISKLKKSASKEKYRYPLFELETKHLEQALEELTNEGRIVNRSNHIALTRFAQEEESIAEQVLRLVKEKDWPNPVSIEDHLAFYTQQKGIQLEEKQQEAVIRFSEKDGGFFILNGSAGCGKTFTLKIILDMLKIVFEANQRPFQVKLLAPTGKAARVASKSTGIEAETIHRGLEYHPEIGFQRNQRTPLDATILVVDESSMMDISLASSLFEAIANGTKVILLGDTKQLPSVGAGNVLHDLINSGMVPVITLDVVKRQGALSGIIKNANRIIQGKMMKTCPDTADAYILHEEEDIIIQRKTIASIKRLLHFPNYTLEDIQVLVPQKKGTIGVYELNALIQKTFNPHFNQGEKIRNIHSSNVPLYFQKGDKVIHVRNNYHKVWHERIHNTYTPQPHIGIANGDTGVIENIETVWVTEDGVTKKKKRIIVRYESGYVFYHEGDEIKELDHAYCLSIHKSQGSQWKVVIIPISRQHSFFLDRNLIYTAWTRCEEFGIVIAPVKTLAVSIQKIKSIKRYTQLSNFLIRQKNIA